MSTNATISVVIGDTVKTIYNHWDGYPEYLLKMLNEHYNTPGLARALVDLGDVSSLRPSLECPAGHTFNTPADDCTIFYGRDRGEDETDAVDTPFDIFKVRGAEVSSYGRQEYNYVFVNGQWMFESEFMAELEDTPNMFVENLVDQIHYDLKSDETAAVYEMIELLFDMNEPAVTKILKNYMPQS